MAKRIKQAEFQKSMSAIVDEMQAKLNKLENEMGVSIRCVIRRGHAIVDGEKVVSHNSNVELDVRSLKDEEVIFV